MEGYVRDHIHTNGIENFWSCLKRGLNGTYISVEPIHLERYVDEQVFHFNLRHKQTDASRFKAVLKDIVGRRLTYAELTGKGAASAALWSRRFARDIAWETEVWNAEFPDHLIHFKGDKFLGPHV